MFKNIAPYNAKHLLDKLKDEGFANDETISDFIIDKQNKSGPRLHVEILAGFGALIASLFIVIGLLRFFDSPSFFFLGLALVMIVAAIIIQRKERFRQEGERMVILMSYLTIMLAGKLLFATYWYANYKATWLATLSVIIITFITYRLHETAISRFMSSSIVLFLIAFSIHQDAPVEFKELILVVFFLIQFIVAAILLTQAKISQDYNPIAYALVISIFFHAPFLHLYLSSSIISSLPLFVSITLTFGLLALLGWATGGIKKMNNKKFILPSIFIVILGVVAPDSILFAIGLIALGYIKNEKLFVFLGVLSILFFIFAYYYLDIDLTLLNKSIVLLGSGVTLLLGKLLFKYKF